MFIYYNANNNSVNPILAGLNEQQKQAVLHISSPTLVIAGAGTGKTTVITHKVMYLISQGIPLDRILAITFTNRAANEMKERIKAMLMKEPKWVMTFHSFGVRLLREEAWRIGYKDFTIYDRMRSKELLRDILNKLYPDDVFTSDDTEEIMNNITLAQQTLKPIEKILKI